jgi:putative DNA primase/helicase
MTAREIAHHLRGRKSGASWSAKCPAHDDRNPSLSLRDSDGKVLVKCHAGCEQTAVVDALRARGLWPENIEIKPVIVQTYNYVDETGKLLYQICRTEPKGFFQRKPDGYGAWINKKGERQVLYHLPELLEAPIVFIAEGEKDVETLRAYGFIATTNAGGAKAPWLPQFSETLRGREVVVVPDNDRPGWERAAIIARALLGVAAQIRVFDLPREVKDITDWFQAGHSECELISRLEDVDAVQH